MVREAEPSINEKEFLLKALRDGIRVDGRGPYDFRAIRISFGNAGYGYAEVQLGRTRVCAKVSCEIVRPYPDRPTEGFLTFNTQFSPMASPAYEGGRPSDTEIFISRHLEKSLKKSRAIDTEGLCILAGSQVWSIRLDIHVLDDEGNVLDCACLAAIAALMHFRRPDVTVSGEQVTVHDIEERNPVPLSVLFVPVCVSFGFFDNGELLVTDPALLESLLSESTLTFTLNVHNEICVLQKSGGIPLEVETLLRCTKVASVKVAEITEKIKQALKEDEEKRKERLLQTGSRLGNAESMKEKDGRKGNDV